jgi:hypothetical protein
VLSALHSVKRQKKALSAWDKSAPFWERSARPETKSREQADLNKESGIEVAAQIYMHCVYVCMRTHNNMNVQILTWTGFFTADSQREAVTSHAHMNILRGNAENNNLITSNSSARVHSSRAGAINFQVRGI